MSPLQDEPIRVLIVDDHAIVRQGLVAFIGAFAHLRMMGEASDGATAVALANDLKPDVILMDLIMPGMDGVEATRRICAAHPSARILVLTSFAQDELIQQALAAGACGYLLKNVSPNELEQAIQRVHQGIPALGPEASRALLRTTQHPHLDVEHLTEREIEVLTQLISGQTNGAIARRLVISETTVKSHVSHILAKLGVANRTEAVAAALALGLVKTTGANG